MGIGDRHSNCIHIRFFIRTLRGYFADFAGRNVDVRLTRMLFDRVLDMKFEHRRHQRVFCQYVERIRAIREFMASATTSNAGRLTVCISFLACNLQSWQLDWRIVLFMMILSVVAALILQIPIKNMLDWQRTAETKHSLLVETIYWT